MYGKKQFAKTSQVQWFSLNILDSTESYILQERRNNSGSQIPQTSIYSYWKGVSNP